MAEDQKAKWDENNWYSDAGYWRALTDLVEQLHHARIAVTPRSKDGPHVFPEAQKILDSNLFREEIQPKLGLLQGHILHGFLQQGGGYKLVNLETCLGLEIPWVRGVIDDARALQIDERKEQMADVFVAIRDQGEKFQEFARLLEPHSAEWRLFLTPNEQQTDLLIASDQEQSFFSLLFVLAEARAHGAECGKPLLQHWLEHDRQKLRSELCHSSLAPSSERKDDTRMPAPDDWPAGFYWHACTLSEALKTLGLLNLAQGRPTDRFSRMYKWLVRQRTKCDVHPSLKLAVSAAGRETTLFEALFADWSEGLSEPIRLCQHILHSLGNAQITASNHGGLLDNAHSVLTIRGLRFNLLTEYLLRKNETISRNFFATPTLFLGDPSNSSGTRQVAAYAMGTLVDMETVNDNPVRVRALRAFLRAMTAFATDEALTDFGRRGRQEGRMAALHNVPFAFAAGIEDLNGHAKTCSHGFQVPDVFYLAAMRAAMEGRANKDTMLKSMIRLPDLERELREAGLSADLFEKMCDAQTGVARRLAQFRLRHTAKSLLDRFPDPTLVPDVPPGIRPDLSEFDRTLVIGVLVTLLKEALQHTASYNRQHATDLPVKVQVRKLADRAAVVVDNPCSLDARWNPETSNLASDLDAFLRHLFGWKFTPPTRSDLSSGRWKVGFCQE